MRRTIWWVAGAVILISAVVLWLSWRANRPRPAPVASAPIGAPAPPSAAAIQNPVPAGSVAASALPTLDASDQPLLAAVRSQLGTAAADLIKPDMLVRHLVVSVDNLSRKHANVEQRPIKPVPGTFIADGNDQQAVIAAANYERYNGFVQALQAVDAHQFAMLYFQYYPLFQQAYQDLGYPNGYFNDRLVQTIDDLLAAPDTTGNVALMRPNVMYQFADAQLEALSVGQKAMIRMGPANEAIVKAKLRELRAAVATQKRPTAPSP